jgi:hypothetical protein
MIQTNELGGVLLSALLLLTGPTRPAATAAEDGPMRRVEQGFGEANPNAPAALSRFAFLIGRWRCEAKVRSASGEWQTFEATWLGRFILDGYAIGDEYRMTGPSGALIVLGLNVRTYDSAKQAWNIRWLNALAGTWTDRPADLGDHEGGHENGQQTAYGVPTMMHASTHGRGSASRVFSNTCTSYPGHGRASTSERWRVRWTLFSGAY